MPEINFLISIKEVFLSMKYHSVPPYEIFSDSDNV